jgi:hypothetical protein
VSVWLFPLKTVRSDNEFTNKPYENYLKKENIKSVLGTPNLPQSQGVVNFVFILKVVT